MNKKYIKWAGIGAVGLFIVAVIVALLYIMIPVLVSVITGQPSACDPYISGGSQLTSSMANLCSTSQSLFGMITLLAIVVSGLVAFLFTILVLIDMVTNPNLDKKILWIVGILILGFLTALLYYFLVKRKEN